MTITENPCVAEPAAAAKDRFSDPATWERAVVQWASSEQKTLVCCRVRDETHDVRTFVFSAKDGQAFSFEPGQFITVSADIDGAPVSRCYTVSSPPTRPHTLSITVKRTPGGVMSNWLHANMAPGVELRAFGPSGVFTPTAGPAAKSLYLSAGSGVTPLMSMTRAAIDLGLNRDIVFVHSARTPDDIIFRDELDRLSAEADGLKVIHVCEGVGSEVDWRGLTGRLSLELLQKHVPDYRDREVFTCGPSGYMNAAKELLVQGGHDPARYHQESFNFAETVEPTVEVIGASQTAGEAGDCTYTVRLAKSGKTFPMSGAETVLVAARKAGVPLPSSCSQGICGTCKTVVLEGTVDMHHNGGIRQREIDKGLRLMCCSRPTSDLVLDL
ncbi:hybrid-cluster NAD(P)-dependent oxidoreductase [Burkholderia vietnamiensis]|uniref:hybrid-cluster NAD(P)-dependent oxidoreductase n=1 Tax=Burkholderia vietnamiensis TaxID=60552 RepID=UPI0026507A03|nr:hybrid-cluster NAD(P)-dependent oxidoreductase [Burkholderia vietnamiensis]MDN8035930.1 hybrid-cluster NAD(P)-dependent oxidoreductase [Burkholderia vietnamiensis]HDR8925050.1 hybrid-cluster NAD(P)-dependent oxidoreductase [Burkholderia vietnamiensis]HDR9215304.1 hybrid-cluster NAD(P)-dependent oxidoreductase [Burkholderia vietnamiensis]